MSTIANLVVGIGANLSGLEKGVAKTDALFGKIGASAGRIGGVMTKTVTPAILGIGAVAVAAGN